LGFPAHCADDGLGAVASVDVGPQVPLAEAGSFSKEGKSAYSEASMTLEKRSPIIF
jgi:hypothetical protein